MSMPVRADRVARFVEMTSPEREVATLEEMFQRMTCRIDGVEGSAGRPEGLPAICKAWDIPFGRYMFWLKQDDKRYQVFLDALDAASHADMSEVIEIADGSGFPQEKRVRLDARFRLAQFHAPRMYAPKQEVTHELGQSFTDALLEISRRRSLEAPNERPPGRLIESAPEEPEDSDGDI